MNKSSPPAFEGIQTYVDKDGVFKFRYALNWQVLDMPEHADGIRVAPPPISSPVWIAVWKQKNKVSALVEDTEMLESGFDEGIQQLGENIHIIHRSSEWIGGLLRMERIFSFENSGQKFQRRQWLIYAGYYQISVIFHALESDFSYWLGMANYSFYSLVIPESVYFIAEKAREIEVSKEDPLS
jgi:hypothetical protein